MPPRLSVSDEPLVLQPPNLKIMAVREYEVEAGATKGQMRSYNIGMEGAALKKDKYVEIDSLWLDENDQMLPEDLGTRGYTGRLAKVAGDKLNDTQVSQFKIQPGLHKNMIKLGAGGQGDLGNEHYYLHVSGGVKDDAEAFRKPDFSTLGGDESGIWSSRPKWAVPFKVTTSREVQDLQEQMAFHEAELKAKDDANYIEDLKNLQANYGWEYRPEFQFSVYDLTVQELQRQYKDENGEVQTVDLMDDKQPPLLQTNDDLLSVIYDLNGGKDARLPGMGPDPLLAWMLVGQEKAVAMGSDKHTDFSNFDYLKNINALEFLALRLYSNNDTGNVLWELILDGEIVFVTPDGDPVNAPVDSGDGKNEFTFSSDSTGELIVSFKAKFLNDNIDPSKSHRTISFGIDNVGAPPKWDAEYPDGKAVVSEKYFIAVARFVGLPENNSDFGKKKAYLRVDGKIVQTKYIEVFFNKQDTNNPHGENLPNWFYYWKNGRVCGIPESAIYDSTADFGYVNPGEDNILRLGPYAATENSGTEVFSSDAGDSVAVTGSGKGIKSVAETVEHELHHLTIYNTFYGQIDTDDDSVGDSGESTFDGLNTSATNSDTYNMHIKYPGYLSYGDNEIRARKKERELGITIHPELDWANPGSQSKEKYGP